jgi:hypothetical protein
MKRKDIEEKMFDLLQLNHSRAEQDRIIKELDGSGLSTGELESIQRVKLLLENESLPEPSEKMDRRFYAMLEDEKRRILLGEPEPQNRRSFLSQLAGPGLKIAAGISLFLLGWFTSGWFTGGSVSNKQVNSLAGEVRGLRETLVLTMMHQSSPVERIKAVNMAGEFENADKQVLTGLVSLLNTDSNDNVRLLALETLARYPSVPEVREGLIASIANQKSPLIQIRLAEIMLALNEKRAVPEFQKVIQNAGLNYSVRGKINDAIVVLL